MGHAPDSMPLLRRVEPHDWPEISALFDKAMALAPAQRPQWLDRLPPAVQRHRALLAQMLSDWDRGEAEDFLHALPSLAPPEEDPSGRSVGAYRLLRLLGRGGTGTVWLAERSDGLLKRTVALKLPHAGLLDAHLAERFARERDILASLVHPHIARLYDAGVTEDGQPFLALEHVDGEPLIRYCDGRRLGLVPRIRLFLQVLAAVQYAHAHLVIHRDIKPSNVMVTSDGQVRLLDFGIAKLLVDGVAQSTELTQAGGRLLTPDYASPEQIGTQSVTTASDIYSLGVLLYELLTGDRPYRLKRDTPAALEEAVLAADVRQPSDTVFDAPTAEARSTGAARLRRELAGDLDTIVLKALKKNPEARYESAGAFAQDLERHLQGETVLARPDTRWYRTRKFVWRHRVAAASASGVVLALAAGLGVAVWQARIARDEARTAQAVQTFMVDIFRANSADQPDPVKARETSARQLLDTGARKIDQALSDAPQAKLDILRTLGAMYGDLGINEQAIAMFEQRVRLTRSLYGNRHRKVAEALVDLTGAMHASPQMDRRGPLLKEALAILDGTGDVSSPLRARALLALSQTVYEKDLDQALADVREAVRLLRGGPAPQTTDTLIDALLLQGSFARLKDDDREAARVLSEARELSKASEPRNKRREVEISAYLGDAQYRLQAFGEAEQSLRLAHRLSIAVNGPAHIDTMQTGHRLGLFLFDTSRTTEGLRLLAEAAEGAQRSRGVDDPQHVPQVLIYYGRSLADMGRLEDGIALMQRARTVREKYAPGSRSLAHMLEYEAEAVLQLGRQAQAARLLDAALEIRRKTGMTAPGTVDKNSRLRAWLLIDQGRPAEALALLGPAQAAPSGPGPIEVDWLEASLARADAKLAVGDAEAAVGLAHQVGQRIAASAQRAYFKAAEARALLLEGKALCNTGRPEAAQAELQRAVALDAELLDAERSPALADAQLALARSLLAQGQRRLAQALLEQARAIQASHVELAGRWRTPLRELQSQLRG